MNTKVILTHNRKMFKSLKNKFSFLLILLLSSLKGFSQTTFTTGSTAAELAAKITGNGVTIINPIITVGASTQVGIFSNGISGANLLIDTGVIFTTGDIATSFSENTSTSAIDVPGGNYVDPEISSLISSGSINDLVVFEFDIKLDPLATVLTIDYQFMSDEYDEYVCSSYNDVFGFFVTSDLIAPYNGYQNISLIPGTTTPVAINTINSGGLLKPLLVNQINRINLSQI